MPRLSSILGLLLVLCWSLPGAASELHIGSAANFRATLEALLDAFAGDRDGITVSYGATGALYAQIRHGAPFDLLLAADIKTPQRLVSEGLAAADSRRTYARGQLALVYQPELADLAAQGLSNLLSQPQRTVAIANPRLAPYGQAAASVLHRIPTDQRAQQLTGSNVLQAYQLWYSGGADTALVARSLVSTDFVSVPPGWHDPIDQQAVLLNRGADNKRAVAFMQFLLSSAGQQIIRRHGYLTAEPDHG